MQQNKRKVKLLKLNWEREMESDLSNKLGFVIREKAFDKEEKNMYGMHSPLFGTEYEDDEGTDDFRCDCGRLSSRLHEGEECIFCHSKVRYKSTDFRMTGWIKINDYKIIQPIYYQFLASIIGPTEFNSTIEYGEGFDAINTHKKSKCPFQGIGMIAFYERFDEIMAYYRKKRKNKPAKLELIDICCNEKEAVFTSAIPVFSAKLRPVSFKGESFIYGEIDRKYNAFYSQVELLNDSVKLTKKIERLKKKGDEVSLKKITKLSDLGILYDVQNRLSKIWDLIFDMINSKEGHIRDQILGGKINFSSRSVIIPDPILRANEIELCYLSVLELYKYEIIMYISRLNNIDIEDAEEIWSKAKLHIDDTVYEIMVYMVEKGLYCDINRNPTINYGSYITMKVVRIKKEYNEDYTMSLPLSILTILNADFDGDALNIYSLKTKIMIKAHVKSYDPTRNLFISRNDGLFNSEMNLIKDQIIGLYQFNNI